MEIRSIEIIKKEEQMALEQKNAADLIFAQQLKGTELLAFEVKRLADLRAIQKLKKDKLAADKF